MEPTPTKHIFAAYSQPRRIITTLGLLVFLLVFLYYIGRMTFVMWVRAILFVLPTFFVFYKHAEINQPL